MKNTLILMTFLLFISANLPAQTYYTGFDDSLQQFGWNQYRKGATPTFNLWEITINGFSNPNCLSHFYPVGGTMITDDWYVSPEFDFENGATIDSLQYSFAGFGVPMPGDTIGVYLLSGNQDPDSATNKTLIQLYYGANYVSEFNVWKKDSSIVIPANSGSSFIAFRYKTIVNWLDVKFDNISIRTNETTKIRDRFWTNAVKLYPNPANKVLNIQYDSKLNIEGNKIIISNAIGAVIYRSTLMSSLHQVDLKDFEKGLYFYTYIENEKKVVKPFIKN